MYRGFNLDCKNGVSESFLAQGRRIYEKNKTTIRSGLQAFLNDNGSLDASLLQSQWFPGLQTEVFISHSHADEDAAISLSGFLKQKFNLDSFVDSAIWGNGDDLLKEIDNKYCYNESTNTYSYEKRNLSTSHVHSILMTAIALMIDKSECLFFLNTPNSLMTKEVISKTASPWIYSEISISQLVRKPLGHFRRGGSREKVFTESRFEKGLRVEYEIDFSGFTDLVAEDIDDWYNHFSEQEPRTTHPLDILYDLHST